MHESFIQPTKVEKIPPPSPYGEVSSKDKLLWQQIVNDWQSSGALLNSPIITQPVEC